MRSGAGLGLHLDKPASQASELDISPQVWILNTLYIMIATVTPTSEYFGPEMSQSVTMLI